MRLLYNLALYAAVPFVLLRLLWKSRRLPEYRRRIGERFGFVSAGLPADVWVHAVSVGEALAAMPLIRALIVQHGAGKVWVTTTTTTGSERVQALLGDEVRHSYAPYDLPGSVARFLRRVQPAQVVVMETELWPNLFRACARRRIPLIVANARLSERSLRGYARVRGLARRTLTDCRFIAAQSETDAQRFLSLGAERSRIEVFGNLKFDITPPQPLIRRGGMLRMRLGTARPVWCAISTHEGEEDAALAAHQTLLEQLPNAVLILVPRHPQRFEEVARRVERSGLLWSRRTQLGALEDSESQRIARLACNVLLGDSMGEMYLYLAASDVAFVGGSLARIGGHNILEPAALGLPVLFGPHMSNFREARALLLRCGAAREVDSASALAAEVSTLLDDVSRRTAMGSAGELAVAGNRGALDRLLQLLNRSADA